MQFESKTRLAQARRHTRIDPRSGIRTLGPVAHCRMGWQGTRTADRCCRTTPVGRARSRHRQMNFRSNCSTQALLVVTSQHRNRRFAPHCGPLKKEFNRCTNSTRGKRLCRFTAASVSRGGKAGRGSSHEPGLHRLLQFPTRRWRLAVLLTGLSGWLGHGFHPLARQHVENTHDYEGCCCGGCEDNHQSISVTANIHAILSAALRSPPLSKAFMGLSVPGSDRTP